jgi:HK97 gp10 family phage protein
MSLTIRGLPQLKAKLARVNTELALASPAATQAGAEVIARDMAERAPKDTGALAASIHVETSALGFGASSAVGPTVPYARFVEFGTRYMAAQPFEEESADSVAAAVVTAMASVFKAVIH